MAKYCPLKDAPALYLDCQDCDEKICDDFFCLVVGSRTFSDYSLMKNKLDYFLQNKNKIVIISGGARGADSLAEKYSKDKGYFCKVFPADWDAYGKSAGCIRNNQMCEYLSKQKDKGIIAFWDGKSKGTAHNFKLAEKYKIPIKIIKY